MMGKFDKAIKIIMAEPPELHYPAYFVDLLREADIPDKDDGNCSETPNGSDLISKQQAIKAIDMCRKPHMRNADCSDFEMEIMMLPSAQPERKKGKWIMEDSIYGTVTCSVCYGVRRDNRINHINFCNCCGADMRGEQDETD